MLPVAVSERCEFLSQAWIDAARSFLVRAVAERPQLSAVRFALVESFVEAPPALGGAVGWHARLEAGAVEVGPGEIPDPNLRISGNYSHALAHAQLVFSAGADAVARGRREIEHRFAGRKLRFDGELPADPAIVELLTDLHDHMAARTVDNPHFDHRVQQLRLEPQVQQLASHGYAVVENAISAATADALCELTAQEVRRHHPLTSNGLTFRHRLFEEVVQNPLVCTLAQSAVGQNMVLGAMSGTYKEAGPGAIPAHADYPLVRTPYPEFGLIAVAVWALQDWSDTSIGPTWVIPGSHQRRRGPRRSDDLTGAIPILMPKGSALLISHGIWHWQGDRSAAGARVALHVTYNRVFVRQLDDFGALNDTMLARNPPAFSTLMGLDDPFGKSSFTGHDGPRFAYAGRFTQT